MSAIARNNEIDRWLVGADARRRVVDLVRIGLRLGDQFLDGLHAERRMHHQHVREPRHQGDRRERLFRVERQAGVEILIDDMRPGRRQQQRVAVRLARNKRGRADVAAGARPADHGERLLQGGGILIRHHARQDVGVAARRERHDDLHGARRIGGLRTAQRRRDHQHQRRKTGDCVFHEAAPVAAAARMAAFMVRHENIESKSRASAAA